MFLTFIIYIYIYMCVCVCVCARVCVSWGSKYTCRHISLKMISKGFVLVQWYNIWKNIPARQLNYGKFLPITQQYLYNKIANKDYRLLKPYTFEINLTKINFETSANVLKRLLLLLPFTVTMLPCTVPC